MNEWCHNSMTIAWARAKMAAGAILLVAIAAADILQSANVAQYLPPTWAPIVLIALGIITEVARRRREWQKVA